MLSLKSMRRLLRCFLTHCCRVWLHTKNYFLQENMKGTSYIDNQWKTPSWFKCIVYLWTCVNVFVCLQFAQLCIGHMCVSLYGNMYTCRCFVYFCVFSQLKCKRLHVCLHKCMCVGVWLWAHTCRSVCWLQSDGKTIGNASLADRSM